MPEINSLGVAERVSAPHHATNSENAYFLIVSVFADNIGIQSQGIEGGLDAELVAKGRFDQEQAEVNTAEKNLAAIEKSHEPTKEEIRSALIGLQAAQAQASFRLNEMDQNFQMEIGPSQAVIEQDLSMGGRAIQKNNITGKTG